MSQQYIIGGRHRKGTVGEGEYLYLYPCTADGHRAIAYTTDIARAARFNTRAQSHDVLERYGLDKSYWIVMPVVK